MKKKIIIAITLFLMLSSLWVAYSSKFFPNIVLAGCGGRKTGDCATKLENQRLAFERHDVTTGDGCFPAGTRIAMADGTTKNIEDVEIRDKVVSQDESGNKTVSTVHGLFQPISDNLCEIRYTDGDSLKVTNGHPLFTQNGWKVIDPQSAAREDPGVPVTRLLLGDLMAKENGSWPQVSSISCQKGSFQTYNFTVDNTHTYFAGGFLAHNKQIGTLVGNIGAGIQVISAALDIYGNVSIGGHDISVWTCFPAGTKVLMSTGDQKNIEDVKVGDQVISQSEAGNKSVSTVSALDQPVRDHMCQINFNNGDTLKLTNEHPLFTKNGWKAIAPRKEAYADPSLVVTPLSRGDAVIKSNGSLGTVKSMSCWSEKVQAYNLMLNGQAHTYFADGYLAHNKGEGIDKGNNNPSCNVGAPPSLIITNPGNSPTRATATWTPVSGTTGQSIFIGTDKTAVNGYCANGTGPGTGCVVANTNLPACTTASCSYDTGDVLSPGTVYYWHLFILFNGLNCGQDVYATNLTSCKVQPSSFTLYPGGTQAISTIVNPSPEIGSVSYQTSGAFITVNPSADNSSPYGTTVTGVTPGSGRVNSYVYAPSGGQPICTDWADVTVNPPPPWWQVGDSDVQSSGNLASTIPLLLPQKYFGLPGSYTGGWPGVPVYSGNTNLTNANASAIGWLANSATANTKVFDYAYFANQIPSDTVFNPINQGDVAGSLSSGGTPDANNYYWYKYDGSTNRSLPLIVPTTDLKDRKVILLVDNANLEITGNINLNDGVGFFMAIAGKGPNGTKGNILVDQSVGGGSGPNLEGIYVADNSFSDTGGALRLHVRGSVVAYGGVQMYRNLGDAPNADQSAEFFEYAPDQIMLFPSKLGTRKINWKEVAP